MYTLRYRKSQEVYKVYNNIEEAIEDVPDAIIIDINDNEGEYYEIL